MFIESIKKAFELLFTFDNEVYSIVLTTLNITAISVVIAGCFSILLAAFIDLMNPRFKKILTAFFNSLLAIPTVIIGLFVYMFISNSGPLGDFKLLFTPAAIVIGQIILAIPIITSFILAGLSKTDLLLHETLTTLGAKKIDRIKAIVMENRILILSAVLAGFGRIVSELGISMMLGGNIRWYTRTITTAIALETGKGEFALALALGFILIFLAMFINFSAYIVLKNDNLLIFDIILNKVRGKLNRDLREHDIYN